LFQLLKPCLILLQTAFTVQNQKTGFYSKVEDFPHRII
jgi:hypothetical protein